MPSLANVTECAAPVNDAVFEGACLSNGSQILMLKKGG